MNPVEQAQRVRTFIQAARLRDEFAFDAPTAPPERAAQYEEAIDVLEERFPDLQDLEPFADASQLREKVASRKRGSSGTRRVPSAAAPRRGRAPVPARSRRGRRGYSLTGAVGRSTPTQLFMQFAGATVGLALLYLLLVNGEPGRGNVVAKLAKVLSGLVSRIISPVDPLGGVSQRTMASVTAPAPQQAQTTLAVAGGSTGANSAAAGRAGRRRGHPAIPGIPSAPTVPA
jgi:hypothetical protein